MDLHLSYALNRFDEIDGETVAPLANGHQIVFIPSHFSWIWCIPNKKRERRAFFYARRGKPFFMFDAHSLR